MCRRTGSPPDSAIAVTIYFWWLNIKGIHESSGKALRIMQITTVMVVMFLLWCPMTLILRGPAQIPPAPVAANLSFNDESLGWFSGTFWLPSPSWRSSSPSGTRCCR